MTDISYYETSINTGKLSVDTKKPSATFLLESLEELELNNTFSITIVVYNIEGMSSQPTSKSFGMNIHSYTAVLNITPIYTKSDFKNYSFKKANRD